MQTQTVEISTADGIADGYLLYPDAANQYPGVVFYMDGIGLRPILVDVAARVAQRGYCVLLPNLFYRGGRAPLFDYQSFLAGENRDAMRAEMMKLIGELTPERVERDARAYLDFLAAQPQTRNGKMATTGYCMGGAVSLRTAAYFPGRIAAAASFHGGNLATEKPDSPHFLAPQIEAELYIGHAKDDHSCPAEQIERLEAALQSAGVRHHSEIYAAGHGWTMPDIPVYNAAAAETAAQRLFDLLDRALQPAALGVTKP